MSSVTESLVNLRIHWHLSFDANATLTIQAPNRPIKTMSFTSDGNDGGGTLAWTVSEDGENFANLGVNTAADPGNPASVVTSATAAGTWAVHDHDTGHSYYRFALSGATSPALNVHVHAMLLPL